MSRLSFLRDPLLTITWRRNWNGWGLGLLVDHGVAPQHTEVDATAPFVPPGPRGPMRVRLYVGPRILVFSTPTA